TVGSLIQ
nr:Chain E, targeting peptide [Bacillus thermotolerans]6NJ8_F Chain F, targeting peptide [Bacillus thermotolerans]6NJ8_G Chain G, targeting peptide [Bacillus thermotolerans]